MRVAIARWRALAFARFVPFVGICTRSDAINNSLLAHLRLHLLTFARQLVKRATVGAGVLAALIALAIS